MDLVKLWTFSLTLALSVITVSASAQELAKPESIKPVAVFSELPDWACAAQFSPVEPLLAIGTYEQVRFYSPTTKKEVGRLPSKTGFIRSLLFSPDGKWLYTGGYQAVEIWDVAGRKRVFARKLHKGYVNDLALSADGMTLLSGGEDRLAKLWRVTPSTSAEGGIELSAEPFLAIPEQPYPVLGVAISPRNDLFATASGEETQAAKPGEVKLWSLSDAAAQHTFPFHEKAATKVAFGAEGTRLASASTDEKVDVYDVDARKALGFFPGHSRPINAVVWWSVRTGTTPTPACSAIATEESLPAPSTRPARCR